ncbi:MAG: NCS2 family permease [Tepidanaerobacteraceae bacterium]|jgi:AGZA family xanthine/uracil permease-like MFS transporter|nr:NCS2 family permease [Thermoanaerobacterales bacterium]
MKEEISISSYDSQLDRMFDLKGNGTNVKTEILAGVTTFVTMAYILFVNPIILGDAGMDKGAVFMATALAAALTTIIMGVYANYPFALASGMGLNAYFAYTMVGGGLSWQQALGAVFISGIIGILVTLSGFREQLIKAIPMSLKHAMGAGIGMFIAFIGLTNAGIVVASEATYVDLGKFTEPGPLLATIGLVITAILVARGVKGGILLGILITTIIGIPMGITQLPTSLISAPPSLAPTIFKLDILGVLKFSLFPVIFSLFFTDMFDSIGTFVGVASRTGMIDEEGNLKRGNKALFVDFIGTVLGSLLGTSTVTTYVESASGVTEGGRTGLTAVVVGILFIASVIFSPIALAVPGEAVAPALIIVGVFMATSLNKIDFSNFFEAFPAFLTVIMMPLTYSISFGLAIGFVAYAALMLLSGRGKEVHWIMYVLAAIFILYFAFIR